MDERTVAGYIKEIGRGKNAARDLSRADAQALFAAMLQGAVPPLQLGAILIALRVKGESLDELAGFHAACEASYPHLELPRIPGSLASDSPGSGVSVPVVIPSYNGARQLPNLVPLLALLLAREGVPVLVHGVTADPGRVTTREVFAALGIAAVESLGDAAHQLASARVAFLPINVLAPAVAGLLALRRSLGVRNSTHTLVKMLQPFAGPALRIVSVTHPDYLARMREYFTRFDEAALLLRGAEGEAVAHPRREPAIEWAYAGHVERWAAAAAPGAGATAAGDPPALPDRDATETARWIERVLAGELPTPAAIAHQVECCLRARGSLVAAAER